MARITMCGARSIALGRRRGIPSFFRRGLPARAVTLPHAPRKAFSPERSHWMGRSHSMATSSGGQRASDARQRIWSFFLVGPRSSDTPKPQRLKKRSEEHTSELKSLMRISYDVFSLKRKNSTTTINIYPTSLPTSKTDTISIHSTKLTNIQNNDPKHHH